MAVFDTPITSDERNLKKALGQKLPAVLVLYDGRKPDKPLFDALRRAAKQNVGELLVVKIDVHENPGVLKQYNHPQLPAVITMTKSFFGRKIKSCGENARPAELRAHIDHLLNDTPLPEPEPESDLFRQKDAGKGASHVTEETFRKAVLKSKVPVLVDFWAPWCGPCRAVAPFIDQMANQYRGQAKVVKVNTDENRRLAARFQIQSIPTFILFDGGQPVGRFSSANPRMIQQIIEEAIASH